MTDNELIIYLYRNIYNLLDGDMPNFEEVIVQMKERGFELDEEGCLIDNEDEEDY